MTDAPRPSSPSGRHSHSSPIDSGSGGSCIFVGPTRTGPLDAPGPLVTSPSEFERVYGGTDALAFERSETPTTNVLAHAVRAFFLNGGTRLHVVRIVGADARSATATDDPIVVDPVTGTVVAWFAARYVGAALEGCTIEVAVRSEPATRDMLDVAPDGTLARVETRDASHVGLWFKRRDRWVEGTTSAPDAAAPALDPVADFDRAQLRAELLAVDLVATAGRRAVLKLEGLTLAPGHARYIGYAMSRLPTRQSATPDSPIVFDMSGGARVDPDRLLVGLVGASALQPRARAARRFTLHGGSDGFAPDAGAYTRGLAAAETLADASLVAAPGYSALMRDEASFRETTLAIAAHAGRPPAFRYAVLELPPDVSPESAARMTRGLACENASFYYPWLTFDAPPSGAHPSVRELVRISPAGHLCGKLARGDAARAAVSGPGDTIVFAVEALEFEPDAEALDALADARINCLMQGDGDTARIRQAMTAADDPIWRVEPLRRYALDLERAIWRLSTRAAHEPDGERYRRNVRETVEDFLFAEWARGALVGSQPDEAYFVRIDDPPAASTEAPASGPLVLAVGFATTRPAEFVTLRIALPR